MTRIVVSEFVSLDGVIHEPMWTFPYWNDEIAQFKAAEDATTDALLLGRVTYEGFAAAWPESTDEGADWMNSIPKYVVSTTLDKAEWNNSRLIKTDVVEAIMRLKQQPGQDLLVYGSGRLVQTLMQHNLIDQYNLLVYPLVLGSGQRLFEDGSNAKLALVDTQTFSSGVVALIYQPAPEA